MFSDVIQWRLIRAQVLEAGVSKRQAARDAGIHWSTLEKILKHPFPPKFKRRKRQELPKRLRREIHLPKQNDIVADIKDKIIESASFIRDTIQAIPGSAAPVAELRRLARFLQERGFAPTQSTKCLDLDSEKHGWMQNVLQKKFCINTLQNECENHPLLSHRFSEFGVTGGRRSWLAVG